MDEQKMPNRTLSLNDCIGIGVNGIVGTGIFMLTAQVWRQAGGKAPFAWVITGILCSLVALCFAEAAARTERSGGPYRYARDVFGPNLGYVVGWITLFSIVVGYATVVRFLAKELATYLQAYSSFSDSVYALVPFLRSNPLHLHNLYTCVIGGIVIFGLAGLNLLGVQVGAKASTTISALKIIALLLFVVVGLFFIDPQHFKMQPHPDVSSHEKGGLWAAAFVSLFALTGVEYISVPAGEVRNPRRTLPIALVGSVVLVTILYVGVQMVVGGVLGNATGIENGIVVAAEKMTGSWGGRLMKGVFVLSALGFCTGSALVGPRYVEVLAQDRFFPALLAKRSKRRQVPVVAILLLALATFLAMIVFDKLLDISNVAVICQYVATCLAVLVSRRKPPFLEKRFLLPGGPIVPLVTMVGCLGMLYFVGLEEWKATGISLAVGLLFGYVWRHFFSKEAPLSQAS